MHLGRVPLQARILLLPILATLQAGFTTLQDRLPPLLPAVVSIYLFLTKPGVVLKRRAAVKGRRPNAAKSAVTTRPDNVVAKLMRCNVRGLKFVLMQNGLACCKASRRCTVGNRNLFFCRVKRISLLNCWNIRSYIAEERLQVQSATKL